MGFNSRLKEARTNCNITQQRLGEIIGVAKSTITGYEKGNSEPDVDKIFKIMHALNVDANFLFQDSVNQKTPATDNGSELDNNEQTLVDTYRDMTPKGQKVLLETAETLHGNFKKDDTVQNGKSVG